MLSTLRMKARLILAFAALATVVVLVSALSLHSLARSRDRFTDFVAGANARANLATDVRGAANRRAIAARNLVLATEEQDRALEKSAVLRADADVEQSMERLRNALATADDVTERERALFADLQAIEGRYGPVAKAIVNHALAGRRDEAVAMMNTQCRPLLAALLKATDDILLHEAERARERVELAGHDYQVDRATLMLACVLAAAAALCLGWIVSRSITTPLARAVGLAEAVASGDLSSQILVDRSDELGDLQAALKKMNDGLTSLVGHVRESADGIATAAAQIASGHHDLSGRTEKQASAVQETAASMHQMTAAVRHSAQTCREARTLAGSAAEAAGRGAEAVERVVRTMGLISEQSRRIADITGVIDAIAFQTNILALNAAVEAARAGEQGRGFAVVAGEVRALAQRSAEAAREIKDLIGASVEKVEIGGQLVGQAGSTMHDVVGQVRRMTELMTTIDASATEQAASIEQVNKAVASIDEGTQQNAALVEEGSAAAQMLNQQAAGLVSLIGTFKLRAA
jgi:methyl-accepting chemotaxis protein-1 (serine sensor receptor)